MEALKLLHFKKMESHRHITDSVYGAAGWAVNTGT